MVIDMGASRAVSFLLFWCGSLAGALAFVAYLVRELFLAYGEDGWGWGVVIAIPACVIVSLGSAVCFAVVISKFPAVTDRCAVRFHAASGVLGIVSMPASLIVTGIVADALESDSAGFLFVLAVVAAAIPAATLLVLFNTGWLERRAEHHCPRCGYDLRQLRSPRCPECGTEVDEASTATHKPAGDRV